MADEVADTVVPAEGAAPRPPRRAPHEPPGKGVLVTMQRLHSISYPRDVLPSPFRFQVAPLEELAQDYTWTYVDYETIGAGTHTRAGAPQLAVIAFDSLFVDEFTAGSWMRGKSTTNRDPHPIKNVQELRRIGDSMLPFQLIVHNETLWALDYDVNMAVTMRSFRPLERAGEIDARYFAVSFTEFRGIQKSELSKGLLTEVRAGGKTYLAVILVTNLPKHLRTMRALSKHYYKTATLWRVIAKASGFKGISGDTDLFEHFRRKDPRRKVLIPKLGAK